jgi:hypothetical protein
MHIDALAKRPQEKQSGDEHRKGHPEMYVGENAGESALALRWLVGHATRSRKTRGYARTISLFNPMLP